VSRIERENVKNIGIFVFFEICFTTIQHSWCFTHRMTLHTSDEIQTIHRRGILLAFAGCVVLSVAVLSVALWMMHKGIGKSEKLPVSGDELFDPQKIHKIHLIFTKENWDAMEPERQGGGFGGPGGGPPGGGPGGNRGGGPGGGPGGGGFGDFNPDDFGVGMMLTGGLLSVDPNRDQKLTLDEIKNIADKWFTEWDTNKAGVLAEADFVRGLNDVAAAAMAGGPGGGSGGRPGGGPGGGGAFLARVEGARNGVAGMAGIVFNWVSADMEFDGIPLNNIDVRYKGNGTYMQSQNDLKRSMKLDLNDQIKGRTLGGATKLNLHSCVTDASYMNEVLSHRLFRDAGVPAPRYSFAEVYLTVPGQYENTYVGLYTIVENLDSSFTRDYFGTKKGVMFKPVASRLMEYISDNWDDYAALYDPKMAVMPEDSAHLIDFFKLVSNADDDTFAKQVENYLDLDEFARFMAITTWISTMDSILVQNQNFLVYLHPKTHQLQFLPWDLDHGFGQFGMSGSQEVRENLSIEHPWSDGGMGGNKLFLTRVFNLPKFKSIYLKHMKEFNETICQVDRICAQVDETAELIRDSVARESEQKLARFDTVVAGETLSGGFGFGGPPPDWGNNGRNRRQDRRNQGNDNRDNNRGPQFGGGFGGPGMPPQGMMPPGGNGTNNNRGPQFGGGFGGAGMPPQMGQGGMPSQDGMNNQRPPFGRPDQQGNFNRDDRNNDRNGNRGGGPGGFGGPGGGTKPIKAFVKIRWQSVEDQLEGRSEGMTPGGFGPGNDNPRGNNNGPGGGGPGSGRQGGFGPGNMIGGPIFNKMDTERTGKVDRKLFVKSFEDWFNMIDTNKVGSLTEVELRRGLNRLIEMPRFGGFGGPGGGGPGMPPQGMMPPGGNGTNNSRGPQFGGGFGGPGNPQEE
jgi:spore coat protein CotH